MIVLESVVESQFAPPLVVLGRLRAGTCAVRRGARVTPPVTDSSVAPQDNFPPWKRQSRSEPPRSFGSLASTAVNDNQSTTITPLPQTPFSSTCGSEDYSRFSRDNRERKGTRVHTCGKKEEASRLTVTRRSRHVCRFARAYIIYTRRTLLSRRRYRSASEADRKSRSSRPHHAVFRADCDEADVAGPIRVRLLAKTRRANRCRAVSRNRGLRAASTRPFIIPATRRAREKKERQRGPVSRGILEDGFLEVQTGTT